MERNMVYEAASPEKQQALLDEMIHLSYPKTYPHTKIPFGHIFQVWADFAEKRIQLKGHMKEKLIEQMAEHLAPTLGALLHVARVEGKLEGQTPEERYFYYIEHILTKPNYLKDLFSHFPPFARTLAVQMLLFIDQANEFVFRLEMDRKELEKVYGIKGEIKEISLSLSDLHNGNRSVMLIKFENGTSLIYKPKPLGLDKAYNDVIGQLNELGLSPKLKTYTILDKNEYGWVEFIHSFSCSAKDEVKRYFERFGMLICFMFLFEGTDCHYENMLASGEDPVLIDLESLFHPTLKVKSPELSVWSQSVFRTGFLPSFVQDRIDISPLTADEEQESPRPSAIWRDVNTDQMQFAFEKRVIKMSIPRPKLGGKLVSSADYIPDLLRGFQTLYELIASNRKKVLSFIEPLFKYPVRCIFRPTALYFQILRRLTDPQLMRSEEKVEETLSILSRFSSMKEYIHLEKIVAAEKLALKYSDIPFFLSMPTDTHIYLGSKILAKDCFKNPAKNRVVEKLENLNEEDLGRQLEYIDHSLYFLKPFSQKEKHLYHPYDPAIPEKPLKKEDLIQEAEKIGEKVLKIGQPISDGTLAWIGLEFDPKMDRYVFQPLSNSFYGGDAGIALFLWALGKHFAKRAEEILDRLVKPFYDDPHAALLTTQFGGMLGLSGLIYTLGSVGRTQEALKLALFIDEKKIAQDTQYDFILGTAGLILVLLSLFEKIEEPSLLVTAKWAGDYLLSKADLVGEGIAWGERHLCGLSHGNAGIAYAFFKLAAMTKSAAYKQAAEKALAYERKLFSPEHENWPDLRFKDNYSPVSWCHGAAGIGLARFYTSKFYSDPKLNEEIQLAKEITLKNFISSIDHLCCGNFGRIAYLWTLDPQSEPAQKQTAHILQKGTFKLFANMPPEIQSPAFMQGLSGIGYFLLQMSGRDLPQVLILE